jgi:hypothetical protein
MLDETKAPPDNNIDVKPIIGYSFIVFIIATPSLKKDSAAYSNSNKLQDRVKSRHGRVYRRILVLNPLAWRDFAKHFLGGIL